MKIIIIFLMTLFYISSVYAGDFTLRSSAFENNQRIPILYTCNGKGISPPLEWTQPPEGTKTLAIVIRVPKMMGSDYFYSWVVFNIPATQTNLTQGATNMPTGATVGNNSFGLNRYYGPCPPDEAPHKYIYTLYALDSELTVPDDAEVSDVLADINQHTIAKTELIGIFSH